MKRTVFSIIMLFLTLLPAMAQDSVEKQLFSDVNTYRISQGLPALKWDSSAYTAAKHHSDYLAIINDSAHRAGLMMHDEKIDVKDFKEYNFDERFKFFIPKHKQAIENAACGIVPNPLGKIIIIPTDTVVSQAALSMWIESKEHKNNLESKNSQVGACAITYVISRISVSTSSGIKTRRVISYYAVFVAYY